MRFVFLPLTLLLAACAGASEEYTPQIPIQPGVAERLAMFPGHAPQTLPEAPVARAPAEAAKPGDACTTDDPLACDSPEDAAGADETIHVSPGVVR